MMERISNNIQNSWLSLIVYSKKYLFHEQQIENGKKCRLEISSLNPNLHLGDWKCEVWNGFQKFGGGQPEEEATIRVVELGVQYSSHLSNKRDRSLEVESGKIHRRTIYKNRITS